MKTNTKIYHLFLNRWAILIWFMAIVIGIIVVPTVVTYAQQPPPPPPPPPIVIGPSGSSVGGVWGNPSNRVPCSGVIADPDAKVWQIWPLNGIIELGNGSQPAMLHIRQCSGFDSEAEANKTEFWLKPSLGNDDDWFRVQETDITLIELSLEQGELYAVDANHDFSLSSYEPGTYTLWIGTRDWNLPLHRIEIRSGPAIEIRNPLTDWPTTSFRSGETIEVTYQGFKPNMNLVVGLYQSQTPEDQWDEYRLSNSWTISSDQNGNYQEAFPVNMPPGWYQIAVCYLDDTLCSDPIQSEFNIISETDASAPGDPGDSALPTEIK